METRQQNTGTGGSTVVWDLLGALFRRRNFIAAVTIAIAVLSVVISLLLPKWYAATTRLLPSESSGGSLAAAVLGDLSSAAGALLGGASGDYARFLAILTSRTVSEEVIRRFDLINVYGMAESDAPISDAAEMLYSKVKFEIDNDPSLIKEVVDFCERMLNAMSTLDRIGRLRIAIAVDQALHNALYRGNLEIARHHKIGFNDDRASELVQSRLETDKYRKRKIRIAIEIKPTRFGICIQDDGPGFDPKTVGSWKEPSLRGTILMKSFMDTVSYNDKGNMVEMHTYFGEPRPVAAVASPAEKLAARIINTSTHKVTQLMLPKMVIGRRTGCHLKLKSEKVAPLHCSLNFDQGSWALINLTNKYTTLRNGNPVKGAQLQSGDLLTIGDQEFTFEAG